MEFLVVFAALWTLCSAVLPAMYQVQTKFEFMHSFKGPHLVDSRGNIPFWNHGGSKETIFFSVTACSYNTISSLGSIPSDESIRVCPSIKSRRGWVWSKNPLSASHWFVDVSVKVTGLLKSGADGMVSFFSFSDSMPQITCSGYIYK